MSLNFILNFWPVSKNMFSSNYYPNLKQSIIFPQLSRSQVSTTVLPTWVFLQPFKAGSYWGHSWGTSHESKITSDEKAGEHHAGCRVTVFFRVTMYDYEGQVYSWISMTFDWLMYYFFLGEECKQSKYVS